MKSRFKKVVALTIVFMLTLSINNIYAENNNELEEAYKELMNYANEHNIPLDMSYDDFLDNYDTNNYKNVQSYLDAYYSIIVVENLKNGRQLLSSSALDGYYYDIGKSLPSYVTPDYSKYNLKDVVKKGDIIYEANGGFGITGHIAIVEGVYYNSVQDVTYIRIIEAISCGVTRSLLDDTRVDDRDVSIYRVNNASTNDITNSINFCVGEVGSTYMIDFAKDTNSSEDDWYCSELVWAAYKNQGIDIETTDFFNEPGITPRDIIRSSKVAKIKFE